MTGVVVNAVDVSGSAVAFDVSESVSIETPSPNPSSPDLARQGRSKRRPRPEYIRDVRRLIVASWLAKTGQRWRWTPLDRNYLWRLAMRLPAWEIMALWDCYLERPWREVHITHFCQVTDQLRDNRRFKDLMRMYRDRLYCKREFKKFQ